MFSFRNLLPEWLCVPLWGDRNRWGLIVNERDECWNEWQRTQLDIYMATQRQGIGAVVNNAGYRVMSWTDLTGKSVLEIGPGDICHSKFWHGTPANYLIADIRSEMLKVAEAKLINANVSYRSILMLRDELLPLGDGTIDLVISFYSLEHIYPLEPYLEELKRVLKPGGVMIGAIPAEGGLAWGWGRMLTSRRWFKKNTTIDPDKIICWEHPNFSDQIISALDRCFVRQRITFWPIPWLPFLDFNLVIRFLYRK